METPYIQIKQTDPIFGFDIGVQPLITHSASECAGRACCVHNPSNHHMKYWPQVWRADRFLMERTCVHGQGHPDPDHLSYMNTVDPKKGWADGIHDCDGCCNPNSKIKEVHYD